MAFEGVGGRIVAGQISSRVRADPNAALGVFVEPAGKGRRFGVNRAEVLYSVLLWGKA